VSQKALPLFLVIFLLLAVTALFWNTGPAVTNDPLPADDPSPQEVVSTNSKQKQQEISSASTMAKSAASSAAKQMPAELVEKSAQDQKPQVQGDRSLAIAETERQGLRGRSGMAMVGPYDHQVFLADPQAYCAEVVPGRIHQTALGGPDTVPLLAQGSQDFTVKPLQSYTLQVQGVANAPVTFQTHGLGAFANGRTTQTVASDASGRAKVTWTAVKGTIGDVVVLAASPLAVGQTRFFIEVMP
jgi:hypothetical protein